MPELFVVLELHLPEPHLLKPRLPSFEPCQPIFEPGLSAFESCLPVSELCLPVPCIFSRPDWQNFVPVLEKNMPKVPEFYARIAAGKAICRGYRKDLDCRTNAESQVRARKAQIDREWEENVLKYGKKEAYRCQYEEWQCLKEMRKLNISDAEKIVRENREANPLITVTVQYRVDRKVCCQKNITEGPLDQFNILEIEQQLDNAVDTQHSIEQRWQITLIIVIVKSRHSRAVWKQQTIDDLLAVQ